MKNFFAAAAAGAVLLSFTAQAQTAARQSRPDQFSLPRQVNTLTFNQLQELTQYYQGTAWRDSIRITNSQFTAAVTLPNGTVVSGQPARILRETSANGGSTWGPIRLRHLRYTPVNSVTTDTTFSFSTTGVTTARFMSVASYVASGPAAGQLAQLLSRTNLGTWRNYGRDTYTYDAAGRRTRVLYEGYVGTSYYNSSQELYTYNAQNLPSEIEGQQDNGSGTGWLPFYKDLYTYNAAGNVTEYVSQSSPVGSTAYVNDFRDTYTYSATVPGRLVSVARDSWVSNAWVPSFAFSWRYDADGNVTSLTGQRVTGPGTLTNYYRFLYTYQRVSSTAKANTLDAGLSVAPNPTLAAAAATLRYTLPTAAPVAMQVLDLTGRTVLSLPAAAQAAGPHTLVLPALPAAGLYLLRLSAGRQSQTVKLTVE